jgi:predicted nucleotidyltransferase
MSNALTPNQRRALCTLVEIWPDHDVVLIGAGALGLHLPQPGRITHDLDLTVAANVVDATAALRARGFTRDERQEHRWTAPGAVRLDVLPITHEDIARGTLVWPESGHVMGVRCCDLVFIHTSAFKLDGTHSLDVATLPVIVLLKMEAWLDRPHDRVRDLQDIGYVLSEYLASDAERHWDDPQLRGIELDDQGALALGHDLDAIALPHHRALVQRFLDRFHDTGTHHFERLASAGNTGGRDRRATAEQRLELLRRGLRLIATQLEA